MGLQTVYAGDEQVLFHGLVTAGGVSLTSANGGTANCYLQMTNGLHAGEWLWASDGGWHAVRGIAGAGTFVAGSQWSLTLPADTIGVGHTAQFTAVHSLGTQVDTNDQISCVVAESGAGSNPVTLTILAEGQPAGGVQVWITTDAAGAHVVAGTLVSDDAGQVVFVLDEGTFYAWCQISETMFVNPTLLTVIAGANSATIRSYHATAPPAGSVGRATITPSGPVADDGSIEIVQGDDYTLAGGRALGWTIAGYAGEDITDATMELLAVEAASYDSGAGTPALTAAGSASFYGDDLLLTVELTGEQTAELAPSPPAPSYQYTYQLRLTFASGHVMTAAIGAMSVRGGV